MLSVQDLINFFQKCNFDPYIYILIVVSHDVGFTAHSSTFADEVDCVQFITINKGTKEKKNIWNA